MSKSTFIAISTGPVKRYCLPLMTHSLMHLDDGEYEVHWGVTHLGDADSDSYVEEIKHHMDTVVKINPVSYTIHLTTLEPQQLRQPYMAILKNRQRLRAEFLDSECTQFLGVGGDNPPKHSAIQLLESLESPIALGLSYQRPDKNYFGGGSYPLVWNYIWTPDDLEGHDIDPVMVETLKSGFVFRSHFLPAHINPEWDNLKVIEDCVGGDGNVLIQREVIERLGWYRPLLASCSEDLLFQVQARLLGYKTRCNKEYHVLHYDEDGYTF